MKRQGKDQEKIYPRLWSFGDEKLKFVFYMLKIICSKSSPKSYFNAL